MCVTFPPDVDEDAIVDEEAGYISFIRIKDVACATAIASSDWLPPPCVCCCPVVFAPPFAPPVFPEDGLFEAPFSRKIISCLRICSAVVLVAGAEATSVVLCDKTWTF